MFIYVKGRGKLNVSVLLCVYHVIFPGGQHLVIGGAYTEDDTSPAENASGGTTSGLGLITASLVVPRVKNLCAMQETCI